MIFNVHAGHNPDGKVACGAVGFIKESTEARRVKDEVITLLRRQGHIVYDTTCNDGVNQSNVLNKIINECNKHKVDLDISIHFNAGAADVKGNGKTTGVEAYVYSLGGAAENYAKNTCKAIEKLGFKNRGVKQKMNLSVLRKTKSTAMLIECCFVDDKDDAELYDSKKMAEAIVYGITGVEMSKPEDTGKVTNSNLYRVQVGAYGVKGNATEMQKKLKAAGFDAVVVKV